MASGKPQFVAAQGARLTIEGGGPAARRVSISIGTASQARNTGAKQSLFLGEEKALGLIEAASHACKIGRPLSYFLSINFNLGKVAARPQDVVSAYLRLATQWLSDRGIPPTYVWALEHSVSGGLHVHIFLHCPAHIRKGFELLANSNWLRLSGITPGPGVFDMGSRIGGLRTFDPAHWTAQDRQNYLNGSRGQLRYLVKGINPLARSVIAPHLGTTAEMLKVSTKHCEPITGKRCGTSENIGATARKRYSEQLLAA